MKHRSRSRHRRPIPEPPSRAQVRQRIRQLQTLFQLEAAAEMSKAEPDPRHLRRLDAHLGFFDEALACMEEAA